ncbi:unnamed protein product [Cuscuta epithymum]|uniref:Ribulose-bisphosphate carboxylase n=1 Tax=Cuscuta epithymum TaxID=186058 RepID=A0AAV0CEN4_9ASTE|nr:unnamed protein product [Cuscuta epithymum]
MPDRISIKAGPHLHKSRACSPHTEGAEKEYRWKYKELQKYPDVQYIRVYDIIYAGFPATVKLPPSRCRAVAARGRRGLEGVQWWWGSMVLQMVTFRLVFRLPTGAARAEAGTWQGWGEALTDDVAS